MARPTPALVSIHDVEPDRLDRVLRISDLLDRAGIRSPTVLVVPGLGWTHRDLDVLRSLLDRGYELAGHGWSHRAPDPTGLYHRLHAAILSRDQAEHLSREREELVRRIRQCHAWFGTVDLPAPSLYVPPAWAMGALRDGDLRELPFEWFEALDGVVCAGAQLRIRLPLIGFEADTVGRELGLRVWNRLNLALAGPDRPVRVSIHPNDLELRLAGRLRTLLKGRLDAKPMGPWLERRRIAAVRGSAGAPGVRARHRPG